MPTRRKMSPLSPMIVSASRAWSWFAGTPVSVRGRCGRRECRRRRKIRSEPSAAWSACQREEMEAAPMIVVLARPPKTVIVTAAHPRCSRPVRGPLERRVSTRSPLLSRKALAPLKIERQKNPGSCRCRAGRRFRRWRAAGDGCRCRSCDGRSHHRSTCCAEAIDVPPRLPPLRLDVRTVVEVVDPERPTRREDTVRVAVVPCRLPSALSAPAALVVGWA